MKAYKNIKSIILFVSAICLTITFLLNIFFTTTIQNDVSEITKISRNGFLDILVVGLFFITVYIIGQVIKRINIKNRLLRICIMLIVIIIYAGIQICWINTKDIAPVADQKYVYDIATEMFNGETEKLIKFQYLEMYPQQLTTSFLWSIVFRVCGSSNYIIIQYLNVIANILSMIMVYLITIEISKRIEVNKYFSTICFLCFTPLIALSTFVYGDLWSIALSLSSIYFIIKYCNEQKYRYLVFSTLIMSLGYMVRMNSIIFAIAISIYIIIKALKLDKSIKEKCIKIIIGIAFLLGTIMPGTLLKAYLSNRYELNPNNAFPTTGFLYMGMAKSNRGNGWYGEDSALMAWEDMSSAKTEYPEMIRERITELASNPMSTIKFYVVKTASMWTENTYSALWYNQTFNNKREANEKDLQGDCILQENEHRLILLNKGIVTMTFFCSLVIIIQNKKEMSDEALLLLIAFVGGFMFHTLWEAKSRYIIPYIVVLFPIISIKIKTNTLFKKKS